ncbi:uncharacterized protein MONOS_11837 [Monocercomonoides exilis]|uniref:uncharacterized protein n=1 Tax=Monocercomonoides exilis TaxID=2049356 RepID=UPI00355A2C8D|nr:hypothetical protein MONOS_11837 [Monocercomonoides exilis]|eukprot:MONOS_11837.1-p1 / transcript=MONOS_11837.1 / gene=MONOS_11837 / organism=Monocercomonoides_exilis_PA203 / gene_product=unspecified product / transcript_product=unspecified product / location=Mono_scaffold00617:4905-5162(-) / protein_length=86 / sequence_SO=supercontig / SO=protein_coding / is_pseudo=false
MHQKVDALIQYKESENSIEKVGERIEDNDEDGTLGVKGQIAEGFKKEEEGEEEDGCEGEEEGDERDKEEEEVEVKEGGGRRRRRK